MGPRDLRNGNRLLADITVVKDSKGKDGQLSCNAPNIEAELVDSNTDKPKLVVCPRSFTRGAFSGKGYPGAPVVTCDRCYPRISKNMETIGMILLHEYTHWDKLMSPVLPSGFSATSTVDYSYGAFLTRLENKILAPELPYSLFVANFVRDVHAAMMMRLHGWSSCDRSTLNGRTIVFISWRQGYEYGDGIWYSGFMIHDLLAVCICTACVCKAHKYMYMYMYLGLRRVRVV